MKPFGGYDEKRSLNGSSCPNSLIPLKNLSLSSKSTKRHPHVFSFRLITQEESRTYKKSCLESDSGVPLSISTGDNAQSSAEGEEQHQQQQQQQGDPSSRGTDSNSSPRPVRKYKLMGNIKLLMDVFEANDYRRTKGSEFDVLWSTQHLGSSVFSNLNSNQKVNLFPRSWECTRKDSLSRNLNRMSQVYGKRLFAFMPECYVWPQEKDLVLASFSTTGYEGSANSSNRKGRGRSNRARKMQQQQQQQQQRRQSSGASSSSNYDTSGRDMSATVSVELPPSSSSSSSHGQNPWIVKPASSSQGKGIHIITQASELPNDTNREDNWIVERYINNPLLIQGRKFDLRIYVAVTSFDPLKIYVHRQGIVRLASRQYKNNSFGEKYSHLTNYSINKKNNACKGDDLFKDVDAVQAKQRTTSRPAGTAVKVNPLDVRSLTRCRPVRTQLLCPMDLNGDSKDGNNGSSSTAGVALPNAGNARKADAAREICIEKTGSSSARMTSPGSADVNKCSVMKVLDDTDNMSTTAILNTEDKDKDQDENESEAENDHKQEEKEEEEEEEGGTHGTEEEVETGEDRIKGSNIDASRLKLSFTELDEVLRGMGHNPDGLWSNIDDLIIKTLISVEAKIVHDLRLFCGDPTPDSCFELFGFDVLVDDCLKPWLMEVNFAPSLATDSSFDFELKSKVVTDTLNIAGVRTPISPDVQQKLKEQMNLQKSQQMKRNQEEELENDSLAVQLSEKTGEPILQAAVVADRFPLVQGTQNPDLGESDDHSDVRKMAASSRISKATESSSISNIIGDSSVVSDTVLAASSVASATGTCSASPPPPLPPAPPSKSTHVPSIVDVVIPLLTCDKECTDGTDPITDADANAATVATYTVNNTANRQEFTSSQDNTSASLSLYSPSPRISNSTNDDSDSLVASPRSAKDKSAASASLTSKRSTSAQKHKRAVTTVGTGVGTSADSMHVWSATKEAARKMLFNSPYINNSNTAGAMVSTTSTVLSSTSAVTASAATGRPTSPRPSILTHHPSIRCRTTASLNRAGGIAVSRQQQNEQQQSNGRVSDCETENMSCEPPATATPRLYRDPPHMLLPSLDSVDSDTASAAGAEKKKMDADARSTSPAPQQNSLEQQHLAQHVGRRPRTGVYNNSSARSRSTSRSRSRSRSGLSTKTGSGCHEHAALDLSATAITENAAVQWPQTAETSATTSGAVPHIYKESINAAMVYELSGRKRIILLDYINELSRVESSDFRTIYPIADGFSIYKRFFEEAREYNTLLGGYAFALHVARSSGSGTSSGSGSRGVINISSNGSRTNNGDGAIKQRQQEQQEQQEQQAVNVHLLNSRWNRSMGKSSATGDHRLISPNSNPHVILL